MRSVFLRLEVLGLIIGSLLARRLRGAQGAAGRTVAIIDLTTNIGDMICATPVFRAIKKMYPACRVVVVGVAKNKEMLNGLADVDAYIVHDGSPWATIASLKKEHADIGVAMNPSPTELGILYNAGAGQVSVFDHPSFMGRAFRLLARRASTVPYMPGQYVPRQFLNLLKPFGIVSDDAHPRLAVDAAVLAKVKGTSAEKFVVIAPGAGHSYKEWPRERFDAVAAYLKEKHNLPSVFVGTTETLEELKATVSCATVVIGNDSGVIQIARAFDIPTLVIAGATDWHEHHIPGPRDRVVHTDGTIAMRSFVSDHEHVDDAQARAQMLLIPVTQVTTELDDLLTSSPLRIPPRY